MTALLPSAPAPAIAPQLHIAPTRVTPTGVGGFVGLNHDPPGEILGRRLAARVFVTVQAGQDGSVNETVSGVTRALLGADPVELRSSGILRLSLAELGPVAVSGQGQNQVSRRELEFAVLYEYLRLPDAAEGVIERIPLLAEVGSTEDAGRVLLRTGFAEGALNAFELIDDPAANTGGPSQWGYDAAEQRIEQRSSIQGGTFEITPNKPGTYLVLRTRSELPPVRDFAVSTELRSDDRDGIGLVFRWQDVDNFYFLLLDERRNYRMLARKVGGSFAALEVPALDTTRGYVQGQVHHVRVAAQGNVFRVHVDGELALEGQDASLPEPGRVGFICRANNQAFFHRLDLMML
jgi:hypothetical protein